MNLGRVPTGPLNSLLERRSDTYTVYEEGSGGDDWNDSNTLSSTSTRADIDVFGQRSRPESYPTGEQREATLSALMAVSEKTDDVTDGNCLVHGGTVFEMTVDAWPDSTNTSVYQIALDERTDLSPP